MQEQRNRVSTPISGLEAMRHVRKADSGKPLRAVVRTPTVCVEWNVCGTWDLGPRNLATWQREGCDGVAWVGYGLGVQHRGSGMACVARGGSACVRRDTGTGQSTSTA